MKTCASCSFFTSNTQHKEVRSGFCHRYPPSVFLREEEYRSIFPPVREDFGCGEHEPAAGAQSRLLETADRSGH